MMNRDQRMSITLEYVQKTMNQCRKRLKNRATLRSLTDLSPTIPNDTRWLGMADMIQRFNTIKNELVSLFEDENTNLDVDGSICFQRQALSVEKQLTKFKVSACELQKQDRTL